MRVLHRRFDITGVLYVLTELEGYLVSYSILCPLGSGVLSGSKKLNRITVLIKKQPVSWSFVRPNLTRRTSCLIFNSLSIAVAAILPLRVR